jgi:hypothetical protein
VDTCNKCVPSGIPFGPKGSPAIDGCCAGALFGVYTNDAWAVPPVNVPGFMNGLKQICHGIQDQISVGHGMYDGQECGGCVRSNCSRSKHQHQKLLIHHCRRNDDDDDDDHDHDHAMM